MGNQMMVVDDKPGEEVTTGLNVRTMNLMWSVHHNSGLSSPQTITGTIPSALTCHVHMSAVTMPKAVVATAPQAAAFGTIKGLSDPIVILVLYSLRDPVSQMKSPCFPASIDPLRHPSAQRWITHEYLSRLNAHTPSFQTYSMTLSPTWRTCWGLILKLRSSEPIQRRIWTLVKVRY